MKFTKIAAGFESPAKGPNHCGQCVHFNAERHNCAIVKGKIEAGDWCKKFEKK